MAQVTYLSRALQRFRLLVLPGILTAFGLQLLRVLFPSLVWYLREVKGLPPTALLAQAAWIALGGFVAAALWTRFHARFTVVTTVGVLIGARLAEQLSRTPALDLSISLFGAAAFVAFLAAWFGHLRSAPSVEAGAHATEGLVLGLALDAGLKGLGNSLDLSWVEGILPVVAVAGLGILAILLLRREAFPVGRRPTDPSWRNVLPLFGLGPFLFLQLTVLQNSGWLASVAGVNSRLAFPLIMLGNVLLSLGLILGFSRPNTVRPTFAVLATVFLAISAANIPRASWWYLVIHMVSQFIMGWGLAAIGTPAGQGQRGGLLRTATTLALASLGVVALTFAYYAGLNVALPFERASVIPAAAAAFGICVVVACSRAERVSRTPRRERTILHSNLALGLLSSVVFGLMATARPPRSVDGEPLRVMTYNIHSAFDTAGWQDPESIAAVIESSGANVIALQEVSRGWLINGSTDLAHWLSHRLRMKVIFQGTSDPVWGNAILARVPLEASGAGPLPSRSALIRRGYLWADVSGTGSPSIRLINTHLHDPVGGRTLRQLQAQELLDSWDGRPATVLVGDLNAAPDSPTLRRFLRGGFLDSWEGTESGHEGTYPSDFPAQRIDWILHTADLEISEEQLIDSQASDHRPLAATVARKR